jgi:hypothetical protein
MQERLSIAVEKMNRFSPRKTRIWGFWEDFFAGIDLARKVKHDGGFFSGLAARRPRSVPSPPFPVLRQDDMMMQRAETVYW